MQVVNILEISVFVKELMMAVAMILSCNPNHSYWQIIVIQT